MRAFLILHRGALGDFILTWPALAALRRKYIGHRFLAIGRPDHLELARALGLIDTGYDCESAVLLPFLAGEALPDFLKDVDAALLWTREDSKMRALLERACSGPVVFHPPFADDGVHVLEHHLRGLSPFLLPTRLEDEACFSLGFFSNAEKKRYALIHPGSGSPAKNYVPEFYAELAAELRAEAFPDTRIVLGPAEKGLRRHYEDGFSIEQPASALQLAQLLDGASLFVGNDSGTSHLAAALGVPTLALYKSTDPARWGIRGRICRSLLAGDEFEARSLVRGVLRGKFTPPDFPLKLFSQEFPEKAGQKNS